MAGYNTIADVRRQLRVVNGDESFTNEEVQKYIDEANLDLFSQLKKSHERDRFLADYDERGSLITKYTLSLGPVVSVDKVIVNGTTKTVTTDYTFDSTYHELNFVTDVLEPGDRIEVVYTPRVYYLAELYLITSNMLRGVNLVNQDGSSTPLSTEFKEKSEKLLRVIKSRFIYSTWQ